MFAKLANKFRGWRCGGCENWVKLGTGAGMCRLHPDIQVSDSDTACGDYEFRRPPPSPSPSPPSHAGLGLSFGLAALASALSELEKGTGQWKN